MPVTNEQRAFWSQKNPAAEFDTVTFSHPAFSAPVRLVANVYSDMMFNGNVYRACSMEVDKPEQGKDPVSSIGVKFSRPQVGDEFKSIIRAMDPFDWLAAPITLQLQQFTEDEPNAALQDWTLYVTEDGIRISRDTLQIQASDDNPMILNMSQVYDLERYPGLAYI
ncbi:hypothetical protein FRN05_17420 [Salmonella enterica subsp. enterica]|uniref:DUF1833 domain-containing protein n=1 Tax=Salmonella enterica TaxID=28901 RepID=A0A747KCR2_SALER|nr:hypothetical protein [Salmonella enterica]ECK7391422.1 hypothetical protein [Salmonella enterica subsp. enterica serovar Meleagridis]EDW8957573.1 hypothetical protein [Salmonella enterica subsp. enterica]EJN2870966.1 hypothetical protein [Salmonella enterica subsp. enterica serovar Techimani]MJU51672.1 hypothetical protein [Salmonella enterica subsp. enterica serovar Coquilhatville]